MRSGLFLWYSDQPIDAMNVYNVSAMLGGEYGMAAGILHNEVFKEIAGRALGELMSHAKQEEDGHLGWVYMDAGKTRPNDLVHACYIVYGAMLADQTLEYAAAPENPASRVSQRIPRREGVSPGVPAGGGGPLAASA